MFSRSSVGVLRQGIREVKETAILIKVLFEKVPEGDAESIDIECEATKMRFNNFLIFSSHLYNNIAVLLHRI